MIIGRLNLTAAQGMGLGCGRFWPAVLLVTCLWALIPSVGAADTLSSPLAAGKPSLGPGESGTVSQSRDAEAELGSDAVIEDTGRMEFSESTGVVPQDYIIKPRDVLSMVVYGEPEMSKSSVRVSMDGNINLPLVGNLRVSGLTITGVEKKVEELLREGYLLNPQVSVLLQDYGKRIVFVLGSVGSPGSFDLGDEMTLIELMTAAGGIAEETGKKILIKRNRGGIRTTLVIDRKRLFEEGDLSLNIPIEDQDFVFVPPTDVIYILGEVDKPGAFPLRDENKTVFRALLQAGLTDAAATRRIRIMRDSDGQDKTIKVNMEDFTKRGDMSNDIDLRPSDVIIVPLAYF